MTAITSMRPYLIRALYEWMLDNNLSPHLLVNAQYPGVQVPAQYVKEGKIVLNINPGAVNHLRMSNDEIAFNARFSGQAMMLSFSPLAVLAMYAKENGEGMVFGEEAITPASPREPDPAPPKPTKPTLKVIK